MADRVVTVAGGKYAVVIQEAGGMHFLRHGEPWTAANEQWAHAGMVLAMAQEIEELRGAMKTINKVASPGNRTLDELARDLSYITDLARRRMGVEA